LSSSQLLLEGNFQFTVAPVPILPKHWSIQIQCIWP